jgi:rod shape-determining protein MreC
VAIRSKPRSTRLLVVVLISLSLATITVDYRQGEDGPLAGLGRSAIAWMAPLQEAVSGATRPVGDFFAGIVEAPSLHRRVEELQTQLDAARRQLAEQQSLEERNRELALALGLEDVLDPPLIHSSVIAHSPSNFEHTIEIDTGATNGVALDDPVVTAAGLVGRVIRVTDGTSIVQLITDNDSAVAAQLVGANETGTLWGQGDDDLRLDLIEPDTEVDLGAGTQEIQVETAGYRTALGSGLYPPGILIGIVSRDLQQPSLLDRYVTVRPAVDFSELRFVTVLHTGDDG